jgi:cytochrome P450
VCAGKAFAEYNMRILAVFMAEMFDLEYVHQEKYAGINNYPEAIVGQSKTVPIEVYLKLRE